MKPKAKVPLNCLFQGCYNPELEAEIRKCKDQCYRYNQLNPNDLEAQRKILSGLLGRMGEKRNFYAAVLVRLRIQYFGRRFFYSKP